MNTKTAQNDRHTIKKALLSWKEFEKKDFSVPYTFTVENMDGDVLRYVGTKHSFDPDDPIFDEIRSQWKKFISESKDPRVVVVESEEREIGQTERDAILNQGGEGGFITYLANSEQIPRVALEPTTSERLEALAEKFPKEQVLYNYAATIIFQWNNLTEQPDFRDYVHYFMQNAQRETKWSGIDFSLELIKNTHQELFDRPFDHTNGDFFHRIINPSRNDTVINKISREGDIIRDVAVVEGIKKLWDEGKSVFVVYGVHHAIMQEPALKKVLG